MKNLFATALFIALLTACTSTDQPTGLVLNGRITNLKVGTVYLQQLNDSVLVTLDSVKLNGNANFTLKANIDQPQALYLYLNKKDASEYNDRLLFFATDTVMTFTTDLYNFEKEAVFKGGKNQVLFNEYQQNEQKLNKVNTDLMIRKFTLENEENPNPKEITQLELDFERYTRKRVLYTINFANNHKDHVVAAYLLLKESENINPKMLDSLHGLMPKKIQTSFYGKKLSEFLKK